MDKKELKKTWNKLPEILRDIIEAFAAVIIIMIILKLVLGLLVPISFVPVVVVISGSMLHEEGDDSWNTWLNAHEITDEQISTFPLKDGFDRGDTIIVMHPTVKLGDVVIYNRDSSHNSHRSEPIIHRVVGIATIENNNVLVEGTLDCLTKDDILNYAERNKKNIKTENSGKIKLYITKGDNNDGSDQCREIAYPVTEDQMLAKTFVKIPKIGYLKLYMVDSIQQFKETTLNKKLIIIVLVMVLIYTAFFIHNKIEPKKKETMKKKKKGK